MLTEYESHVLASGVDYCPVCKTNKIAISETETKSKYDAKCNECGLVWVVTVHERKAQ